MAQDRYSIYSASITDGETPLHLQQLRGTTTTPGTRRAEITPGGAVDRGAVMVAIAEPTIRFESGDLAKILAAVSITAGYNAASGATIRAQQRANQGVFTSGSNHVTIASSKGFLMLERIRVSQDDETGATCELMYHALSSDGLTAPLTYAAGQALAQAPAFNSRFFMGPVYLGSSQLAGLQSWECESGVQFMPHRADGDVWASNGSIVLRNPIIRLTFSNLAAIGSVGNLFLAAAGSAIALYARKGASGGTRVADATAQHCAVAAATGAWGPTDVSVRENNDYTTTIEITPTGTITASVASAIPAA